MTTTNARTAEQATPRKDFETLKREFEQGIASGTDYTAALLDLSTAIAAACLNKCIDPQRKNAAEQNTVSNSGNNPALLNLKRGIFHDLHLLENTRTAADKATRTRYNADGDTVTETADPAALAAFGELIGDTLSDGLDLVNTAAAALLEQAAEHAPRVDGITDMKEWAWLYALDEHDINGGQLSDSELDYICSKVRNAETLDELTAVTAPHGIAIAPKWLDTPYTVRRLARKVYIRGEDSAAYRDEETTPIQEVYKAVRRAIQNSRAMQTDPRNGYTYIEDMTADGLDTIYHRLQKWADLGGYDRDGHYTADPATVDTYEKTLAALNLSDRQLTVVNLRMRGYGKKAIGTYLGIDPNNVGRVLKQVQAKAEKIGFTPTMWAEMTAEN